MHWNGEDERVCRTKIICFSFCGKQIILLSFLSVFFFPLPQCTISLLGFCFSLRFWLWKCFFWCRSAICLFDVKEDRLGYNTEGKNAGIVECWYD
jgi:hypothetical protein